MSAEQQQYRDWFISIDQAKRGMIDAAELQSAMRAGGDNFSNET